MDPGSGGPDLIVVLLGNCGVGKSASGNTILGRTVFESKTSFKPGETEITEETGCVFGKLIRVIDTPGILGSEELVRSCCQDVLRSSSPHLFLLVVKTDRFTTEQKKGVEVALRAVGDQGFSCCYLLFTGGDALKNTSVDDFIYQDTQSSLPDVVSKFSGRFHLFNNEDGGQKQVQELLQKAGHLHQSAAACVTSEVRRIVLIGPPGSGKSSSGNSLLGCRHFKVDCNFHGGGEGHACGCVEVEGGLISVVDSAGLSGEGLTWDRLLGEIRNIVQLADPGPHVLVVVVKIGRLSAADSRLLTLLTRLFEGDASRHAAVLFTHGDALVGQSLQDQLRSSCLVSELVSCCRGRYCVLDNTERGERQQVMRFLRLIDEIIRENEGRHCSWELLSPAKGPPSHGPEGWTLGSRLWLRLCGWRCAGLVGSESQLSCGASRPSLSLLTFCCRLLSLCSLFRTHYFHWI